MTPRVARRMSPNELSANLAQLASSLAALAATLQANASGEPNAAAEYLSTDEAADVAGVATGTMRRWIRERRIKEYRAGRMVRVKREDLEKMLASGRRKGTELSPEELAERAFR